MVPPTCRASLEQHTMPFQAVNCYGCILTQLWHCVIADVFIKLATAQRQRQAQQQGQGGCGLEEGSRGGARADEI